MSTVSMRPAAGRYWALILSEMHHSQGGAGRACGHCGCVWHCARDPGGHFHVSRNRRPDDEAILDWHGNNVCVECCAASAAGNARADGLAT